MAKKSGAITKPKYTTQYARTEENKKRRANKLAKRLNKRRQKRLAKLPTKDKLEVLKKYATSQLSQNNNQ